MRTFKHFRYEGALGEQRFSTIQTYHTDAGVRKFNKLQVKTRRNLRRVVLVGALGCGALARRITRTIFLLFITIEIVFRRSSCRSVEPRTNTKSILTLLENTHQKKKHTAT